MTSDASQPKEVPKQVSDARLSEMFANLQAAYAELTHAQFEQERRANETNELRALFERVIESMSEALFVLDNAGRVVRINRAAGALLERDRPDFVGKLFTDVVGTGTVPTTPKALMERNPAASLTDLEVAFRSATGRAVPISLSCGLIRDRREKITGVLIIARDVTEIKKAQQAERELLQLKEDFVASVSHELRTPLASIKGFVELILKGKVDDPGIQHEFLTRVVQESDRLMVLVNDLLDVSRMESGRFKLDLGEADLRVEVGETLRSLETLAQQKKVTLTSKMPDQPLTGKADWRRIRQVLVNLVANAIKFTEAHRSIVVAAEMTEENLCVNVTDEGAGIPAEALSKLFEKFYQVADPVRRAASGTGLGLYLSRLIVEAHGGRIWVESELGKGSTFSFRIPSRGPEKILSQ